MGFLPKSRTARRRLAIVAVAGGVMAVAGVLAFFALGATMSFFYLPSQAAAAHVPPGKKIQLGGLVVKGSLVKHPDGRIEFTVTDPVGATARIRYQGDVPDLFREGQGAVCNGAFAADGAFDATNILAKHDEKYMPRDLERQLKAAGEWRGDGAQADHQYQAPGAPVK